MEHYSNVEKVQRRPNTILMNYLSKKYINITSKNLLTYTYNITNEKVLHILFFHNYRFRMPSRNACNAILDTLIERTKRGKF